LLTTGVPSQASTGPAGSTAPTRYLGSSRRSFSSSRYSTASRLQPSTRICGSSWYLGACSERYTDDITMSRIEITMCRRPPSLGSLRNRMTW
jgi:hypothetical protein